jgi:protein tyrosine phosphatase (PTP) superfamily phosphohydrolase (DUF442 family)
MYRTIRTSATTLALGVLLLGCSDNNDAAEGDASIQGNDAGLADSGTDAQAERCTRWVLTDEVRNARDIGGWAVEGGKYTVCDKVYHGGDLTKLDEQCDDFATLGIKTVLDLRAESEQAAAPNAACVDSTATSVTAALPKLLPDSPENYEALLDATDAWKAFFDTLADEQNYPVYTHCIIGRDRAGLAGTMMMLLLGASEKTAEEEFVLSEDAEVPVKVASFRAFVAELNNRGGIDTYLDGAGVSAAQRDTIRGLLLEDE